MIILFHYITQCFRMIAFEAKKISPPPGFKPAPHALQRGIAGALDHSAIQLDIKLSSYSWSSSTPILTIVDGASKLSAMYLLS